MAMVLTGSLLLVGVLVTLVSLTAVGQTRRGSGLLLALAAGLLFPVTWTVWYLRDERALPRALRAQ